MDTNNQDQPLDKRCRETKPEIIVVDGMTYERNDVTPKKYGESERSANRRDNEGAPYIFFGNVKYRPEPNYDDYIRRRIQQHTPASSTAKRRRAR